MNAAPWLHFLRPYAHTVRPAPARRAAYLRFYQAACGSSSGRLCKRYASSQAKDGGGHTAAAPADEAPSSGPSGRPAAVALRIKELSEAGALRYPRYQPSQAKMTVRQFQEEFGAVTADEFKAAPPDAPLRRTVELSGRLMSIQRLGSKLVFLKILEQHRQVQVMCNLRSLHGVGADDFKRFARLFARGDHVSVTGTATRTATGELTLDASELPRLLSPGIAPLPTQLLDEDTRAQSRHLDLLVNAPTAAATLRVRARVLRAMRRFFDGMGFAEVQTPILAARAGGAAARPFATAASEFPGRELALRIAPELWLKRLVVGGLERVYEIGPAFRNESVDGLHNPEYTTCEFYAAYWDLPTLIAQTERLVADVARDVAAFVAEEGSAPGAASAAMGLPPVDVARYAAAPFRQLEFIPTVEGAVGFTLPDLESDTALGEILARLEADGVDIAEDYGLDAATVSLPKLLDALVSPHLELASVGAPLFVTHHPACMSPLAKAFRCPRTGQLVSARAELFDRGCELANMYEEENDPFEQRRKFLLQARGRRPAPSETGSGGGDKGDSAAALLAERTRDDDGEAIVADESFVAALESGLPPTGGWGCGVDRLVMQLAGARRIGDTLAFGTLRHVVAVSGPPRR